MSSLVKLPILIIAGEQSGEEHAQSFLPELKNKNLNLDFFGVGGEYFQSQGVELLYEIKDFAAMGFSDVIFKIPYYLKAKRKILQEVKYRNCKHAILIDFQTFNLSLAKSLSQMGVKVFYYVAPQAWVWKEWRARVIENFVEHLFCILPFEEKWFRQRGVKSISTVKHPLMLKARELKSQKKDKEVILCLPGSRESEVKYLIPLYSKVINRLDQSEFEFILVKTQNVDEKFYYSYEKQFDYIFDSHDIDDAFKLADLSLAASGTVTLECGLWNIPTVVCYKISLLNEFIVDSLVDYKGFVSLVNLILEKEVFPELLREECEVNLIFHKLLEIKSRKKEIKKELNGLHELLVEQESNAAQIILGKMSQL